MEEDYIEKGIYSWPIIIIAFIFFWPLGIFLLIKRSSKKNKASISTGKFLNVIGIVSYVLACMGVLVCFTDEMTTDNIFFTFFFLVIGIICRFFGKKKIKQNELAEQYISILKNSNRKKISEISNIVGKTSEQVKKDIEEIIKKGYLPGTYINMSTNEIILPNEINNRKVVKKEKILICNCCGAKNIVTEENVKCEYCNMPLEN